MNKKAFIPISALMGALLLALVATMTPFVAEPDRAHAQTLPSTDATLSALTVVGGPNNELSGTITFVATTNNYTLRIGTSDSGVAVTPTASTALPSGQSQTIRVNGTVVSGDGGTDSNDFKNVSVARGSTATISIVVTAPAGNANTYTVKVYRNRLSLSNNADLSSLSISPSGGMKQSSTSTPAAPVYEARVQAGKVTVSYSLSDSAGGASAAVTVDGSNATQADATNKPNEITLANQGAVGVITVTVTAENASTKVHTINVYRIRDNPSPDATLSGLTLVDQASADAITFAAATRMYDVTVANTVEYVTVAPAVNDVGAHFVISPSIDSRPTVVGHQVNLRAGVDTTITVTVTAEDPSSVETYTIKIYKRRAANAINPAINDVTLSALGLSVGTLTPAFSSGTTSYSAQVADDVGKVTVSYTPTNNLGGVTVAVTGSDGTNALAISDTNEVTLGAAGTTSTITLAITAEDGNTATVAPDGNAATADHYIIEIYRLRALPSGNAALGTWTINGTAVPGFTAGQLSTSTHRVTVPFTTTAAAVVATPTQSTAGATAVISPASPVALAAGTETEITVTVTAEDRVTTAEYKVIVYRQRDAVSISDVATLSALSLSAGSLMPAFTSDRMEYDARVGGDVGKVTVSSTPTDNAGGVTVAVTNGTTTPATQGTACATGAGVSDDVTLGAGGTETLIHVCVTPENGAAGDNKVYAITVYRERTNLNIDATLSAFAISDVNVATGVTANAGEACGSDTTRTACDLLADSMPIVEYRVRTVSIDTTANDPLGAVVEVVSPADKNPSTARHDIDLPPGAVTEIEVMVTAEDSSVTKTYMASVYRRALSPSKDATLSSLMLSGVPLMYTDDNDMEMTGFMSDVMTYTADAGSRMVTVTAMANHIAAQRGITITPADADASMDGWQVDLGNAIDVETDIMVQVRPESVTADAITAANNCTAAAADRNADLECYTVTVTRTETQEPRDGAALLAMYDADNSGSIEMSEISTAIDDFFDGVLTAEEMSTVIDLFFG